jgi:hypothetical protein
MCIGLNPYKAVEMWKNYHPVVPPEFHDNRLYAEPKIEQWSKVKIEKLDRSEFWAALKAKIMRQRRQLKGIHLTWTLVFEAAWVLLVDEVFSHNNYSRVFLCKRMILGRDQ